MKDKAIIELVQKKRSEGMSLQKIADQLYLSKSTVQYMVKNDYNRPKKRRGPKKRLTERISSRIKRAARKIRNNCGLVTAKKVRDEAAPEFSIRRIQMELKKLGFRYQIIEKYLPLTPQHKQKRVTLAKKWLEEGYEWKNTIFTDEKRFSKDGPDNEMSWMENRNDRTIPNRKKRQQHGGGLMIWGAITFEGKIFVHLFKGGLNGMKYASFIQEEALPWIRNVKGNAPFIFQQDNAAVHTSRLVKTMFDQENVEVLDWPSRSPDLNPIENFWKILSDDVYEHGAFDNDMELWNKIRTCSQLIECNKKEVVKNLFLSMNRRLLLVLEGKGNTIKY